MRCPLLETPSVPAGRIRSVQALRAIAAGFVVVNHATVLWQEKFDPGTPSWGNGNAGVDLFFVISGFIMVVSSQRLRGATGGWRQFAALRLVRIVPLYWALTAAKLAAILADPAVALRTRPTAWNIVASFLFVPSRDAAGDIRPVLPVGWTLSYEMLFYALFALALYCGIDALLVVAPAMCALAAASAARTSASPAWTTLADPIVLEFVFGVMVGQGFLRGRPSRNAAPYWLLLAAACLACLILIPISEQNNTMVAYSLQRVVLWGLPATALLATALGTERWLDRFLPAFLVKIGEASYSLYLVHGFVIPLAGWLIQATGLASGGEAHFVSVSLAMSIAAGLLMFAYIEAPVTAGLRHTHAVAAANPSTRPAKF